MRNYLRELESMGNHIGVADKFILNKLYEEEYDKIKNLDRSPEVFVFEAEFSAFNRFLREFTLPNNFYKEYRERLKNWV